MNTLLQPLDFLVFRTPLLPFSDCRDLSAARLKALYGQAALQEALFIASPELCEVLQAWLRGEPGTPREQEKLELTLTKYLLRMAYRPTPYGLFAGISLATMGSKTGVRLVERARYQRHSRLDMDYLCALAGRLGEHPELREVLTYYPNNTRYAIGEQLRYVEYRVFKKMRTHHLSNVDHTVYVQRVLDRARGGARPPELAAVLVDEEVSPEEARAFVSEMIGSQLLVSELEPALTGEAYMQRLIRILAAYPAGHAVAARLGDLADRLRALDANRPGNAPETYRHITRRLGEMDTPFEPGQLFQVDMHKPARSASLHLRVVDALRGAIDLLARVQPYREPEALKRFREAFQRRYEEQEVPLLHALDTEAGLGYPAFEGDTADYSPLLEGIPVKQGGTSPAGYAWSPWQQFLLEQYSQVLDGQQTVLQLDDQELPPPEKAAPRLASSLYTIGSVMAPSADAIDRGEFTVYHYATGGPSAGTLLGRFCHLDPQLTGWVKEALHQEAQSQPEAVFAEVAHLSQGRTGNVSARPVLRPYEIPILVHAGADEDHTIPLHDLLLSVRNGRLVLRSRKLGKEVIPRLSSAHNYAHNNLPVYQFLCSLQHQSVQAALRWHWGALEGAPFLPRVVYGKVILAKARWLLKEAELAALQAAREPGALAAGLRALRERRGLPRWVTVSDGDNTLPLDLENALCQRVLVQVSRSHRRLALEESLFHEANLWVEGPEGLFTHEFILPFRAGPPVAAPVPSRTRRDHRATRAVPRRFGAGSEWLYFKLYTGVKTADQVLTEVLNPLTENLLADGVIDKWFFIRYADPEPHLRVRFHGAGTFYAEVIRRLHQRLEPLMAATLVTRLQTDTYQRELERYGAESIEATETLFFHDSAATVDVLSLLGGDAGEALRWPLALRGVDQLLADFGLDLTARKALLDPLHDRFKREFNANTPEGKKALGDKFRRERKVIEQVLAPGYEPGELLAPAFARFGTRSRQWADVVAHLRGETTGVPLNERLASYVHMFLNRFFRSRQRMHELVIYDMLHQYYASQLARQKQAARL